jgi:leader peptidase (prepilin peptidase) / N-methyltransferase
VNMLTRLSAAKSRADGGHGFFNRAAIGAFGVFCVGASFYVVPGVSGAAGAALALNMLAIAVIDWRFFFIPDELNALAIALGLIALGFDDRSGKLTLALDASIRGATMAVLFYALRFAYRRLRGCEGMGIGDVKLAGVAGIWLDWPSLTIAVEIAAFGALGLVLSRHVQGGRALDPLMKLPFGAFFAPAIWICWLLARSWS